MANRPAPVNANASDPPREEEAAAVSRLFHAHFVELARYAYRYLGSAEEAQDVVHDVFLRLWQLRAELDARANPRAYLYTMTRNRALDVLRRRAVEERGQQDYASPAQLGASAPNPPSSPAESTGPAEIVGALREAIQALPKRQREVIELRWWQQASYEDIGRILGISPNTAGVHMTRAIDRLREALRRFE